MCTIHDLQKHVKDRRAWSGRKRPPAMHASIDSMAILARLKAKQ